MQWLKSAFVAGALGGMSPELARLLVRVQDGQLAAWLARLVDKPATSIAFAVAASIVIFALLGLLGGLVAHFGNEPNIGKAYMLGIGAPAFILSTVGASSPPDQVTKDTKVEQVGARLSTVPTSTGAGWLELLVGTAHAQTALPTPEQGAPLLTLDTSAIAGDCADCRLIFKDVSGSVLASEAVGAAGGSFSLPVPDAAATATLEGVANANNAQFSLDALGEAAAAPSGEPLALEISKSRNFANDLRFLLGNNAIQPFDIELKATRMEMIR